MCNFCNKRIRFWQRSETVGGNKYHRGCAVMVDKALSKILYRGLYFSTLLVALALIFSFALVPVASADLQINSKDAPISDSCSWYWVWGRWFRVCR